jgi:DNA-binding CsgD family transcriptional regulator
MGGESYRPREAVRNLTADGHGAREIADIAGVGHDTAARAVRNLTAEDAVAALAAFADVVGEE